MKNLLTEGASSLKDLWLIFSQGPLGARPKLWRTRESQWKRVSCSGKSTSSISSRGVNWPQTHMNPQELTDHTHHESPGANWPKVLHWKQQQQLQPPIYLLLHLKGFFWTQSQEFKAIWEKDERDTLVLFWRWQFPAPWTFAFSPLTPNGVHSWCSFPHQSPSTTKNKTNCNFFGNYQLSLSSFDSTKPEREIPLCPPLVCSPLPRVCSPSLPRDHLPFLPPTSPQPFMNSQLCSQPRVSCCPFVFLFLFSRSLCPFLVPFYFASVSLLFL